MQLMCICNMSVCWQLLAARVVVVIGSELSVPARAELNKLGLPSCLLDALGRSALALVLNFPDKFSLLF